MRMPEQDADRDFGSSVCSSALHSKRQKPTLGLRPRRFWLRDRKIEIIEAMMRCATEQKPIPIEWVQELSQMILCDAIQGP